MFDPIHILSELVIIGGFVLVAGAWKVLYQAQRGHRLATVGPYASVRHPQYDGFILIMTGFLLQWPTLLTLMMFPILVVVYVTLAHREEREATQEYGQDYVRYAARTPGFIPRLRSIAHRTSS
jgi:methanethiol S-methyltransferase